MSNPYIVPCYGAMDAAAFDVPRDRATDLRTAGVMQAAKNMAGMDVRITTADETVEVFGRFKLAGKEQKWRYYGKIIDSTDTVATGGKKQTTCTVAVTDVCNDANKNVDQKCEDAGKKKFLMGELKKQDAAKFTGTNITENMQGLYYSKRKVAK